MLNCYIAELLLNAAKFMFVQKFRCVLLRNPIRPIGIVPDEQTYLLNFLIGVSTSFLNSTSLPSACSAIWPLVAVQL